MSEEKYGCVMDNGNVGLGKIVGDIVESKVELNNEDKSVVITDNESSVVKASESGVVEYFIAVTYGGTNRNAYSTDGINWTSGNFIDGNWTSVCYGNGKFVAVAGSGDNRNAYSTDGINWTSSNSIDGNSSWQSVCYGNGKFVAVAYSGSYRNAYSTDGINWTNGNSIDGSSQWYSVCYGNVKGEGGMYVAVASSGGSGPNRNAYSTDGITWTSGNSIDGSSQWWSVCYGNGKFVAVSSYGANQNAYSEDGINWTSGNSISESGWRSVCYGNGKFVAVAFSKANRNAYSEDGINWISGNSIDSDNDWYSVCIGPIPLPPMQTSMSITSTGDASLTITDTNINITALPKQLTDGTKILNLSHYGYPEDNIDSYSIGKPVFFTGKTYRIHNNSYVQQQISPTQDESENVLTTDCIYGLTLTRNSNYLGVITSVDKTNKVITFVSHGNIVLKVDDSSKFKRNALVLSDLTLFGDGNDNAVITSEVINGIIGICVDIIDDKTITLFRK